MYLEQQAKENNGENVLQEIYNIKDDIELVLQKFLIQINSRALDEEIEINLQKVKLL